MNMSVDGKDPGTCLRGLHLCSRGLHLCGLLLVFTLRLRFVGNMLL